VVIADEAFRFAGPLGLVGQLRDTGRRVDYPLNAPKVRKQFENAETLGAVRTVIVGAEWPQVKLRTLANARGNYSSCRRPPWHLWAGS